MNRVCPRCKTVMGTEKCLHCLQDTMYQDLLEQALDGVVSVVLTDSTPQNVNNSHIGGNNCQNSDSD